MDQASPRAGRSAAAAAQAAPFSPPGATPSPPGAAKRPHTDDVIRGTSGQFASRTIRPGDLVELYHTQDHKWQPGIVYAVRLEYHETWPRAEGWDSAWSRDAKHVETVEVRSLLPAPTPVAGADDAMDTVANWRDQVGDVLIWDENCGRAPLPKYFWEQAGGRSRKLRRAHVGVQPTTEAQATAFRESERRTAAQPTKLKPAFRRLPEETQAATEAFMREVSASLAGIMASAHFQTSVALFAADPAAEVDSVTLALAHLAARIAATDAGVHQYLQDAGLAGATTTSTVAATDLCHRPTGAEAVEELRKMPPFTNKCRD